MKKLIGMALIAIALAAAPPRMSMGTHVTVVYVPLGIWPLCAVGVQMPGCSYAMEPAFWVKMTVLEDLSGRIIRVISQEFTSVKP